MVEGERWGYCHKGTIRHCREMCGPWEGAGRVVVRFDRRPL